MPEARPFELVPKMPLEVGVRAEREEDQLRRHQGLLAGDDVARGTQLHRRVERDLGAELGAKIEDRLAALAAIEHVARGAGDAATGEAPGSASANSIASMYAPICASMGRRPLPAFTHKEPGTAPGRMLVYTGMPGRSRRVMSVTRVIPSRSAHTRA